MDEKQVRTIFEKFDTGDEWVSGKAYGSGHINDTYRIIGRRHQYTLQAINQTVFKEPEYVMHNVSRVTRHLADKIRERGGDPMRETLNIIRTKDGNLFYYDATEGFYRLFYFIDDARTYSTVETPRHFYNAARAFGQFQNMLDDFPAEDLYETIPHFHDTVSRYGDFLTAVTEDRAGRKAAIEPDIAYVTSRRDQCGVVVEALKDGSIPMRVTHNDTKYDNILIDDATGEAICVIDLDTVMPGSGLYDFGDSIRFGCNTGAEDEVDLSKVHIDLQLFEVFSRGWLETLHDKLTPREIELLPFSAWLITFECGMRFLTDYLNGDVYFKTHRPGHNLDRARAQFRLAMDMEQRTADMKRIIDRLCAELV